jgi:hypothetical protein
MDDQTIYVKTARGLRAVVKDKAGELSQDIAEVFEAVDGRLNFQGLLKKLPKHSAASLQHAIESLIEKDYVRKSYDVLADEGISIELSFPGKDSAAKAPTASLPPGSDFSLRESIEAKLRGHQENEAAAQKKLADEQARKITAAWQREVEVKYKQNELAPDSQAASGTSDVSETPGLSGTSSIQDRPGSAQPEAPSEEDLLDSLLHAADAASKTIAENALHQQIEKDIRRAATLHTRFETAQLQGARATVQAAGAAAEDLVTDATSQHLPDGASASPAATELRLNREDQAPRGVLPAGTMDTTPTAASAAGRGGAMPAASVRRAKVKTSQKLLGVFALLVLCAVILHFISFDHQLATLEKTATAQFGRPVKAERLNFSLFPSPRWRLHHVVIGNQGQISVAQVDAQMSLAALFGGDTTFKQIEAESAVLDAEGAAWLLANLARDTAGGERANPLGIQQLRVRQVAVNIPGVALPVFNAEALLNDAGHWQKLVLNAPEQEFKAELVAQRQGVQVTLAAAGFQWPLQLMSKDEVDAHREADATKLLLKRFSAKGMLLPNAFVVSAFSAQTFGGYVDGKAKLAWGSGWTLTGEATAKALDTQMLLPALSSEGELSGRGTFAMNAADLQHLADATQAQGEFSVGRGVLQGIDLGRMMQGLGGGGKTDYDSLSGQFACNKNSILLRKLTLLAGGISARGDVDVSGDKFTNSRILVELKSASSAEQGYFSLAGSLSQPQFVR